MKKTVFGISITSVIVILIIGLILLNRGSSPISYWVDNISFESTIYNNNGIEESKSYLSFGLYSNKENSISNNSFFSKNIIYDKLNNNSVIYFKCHNGKNNDSYYLSLSSLDFKNGIHVNYNPSGPNKITNADSTNIYEIKDSAINKNSKDIDYCEFIGIVK